MSIEWFMGGFVMEKGIQTVSALALGVVFVVIGIVGFVFDPLLSIFNVNAAQNVVHLVTGAVAIVCAVWGGVLASRWYNRIFGGVYAALAILGFVGVVAVSAFLDMNVADHWLHAGIGVVQLVIGFGMKD